MVSVRGCRSSCHRPPRVARPDSRKPAVEPATLEEDVIRRDFTVNTLLGICTGEQLDLTGRARGHGSPAHPHAARPRATFLTNPLRLFSAVLRGEAGQIGRDLPGHTACAPRTIISSERIGTSSQDPDAPARILRVELRQTGLLGIFARVGGHHGVQQKSFTSTTFGGTR